MVRLPPCRSSLTVLKYVGDGNLFPTIGWLRDHVGRYWMVEFVRPAELTDIPPDGSQNNPWQVSCVAWERQQQPGEEFLSKNEQQQNLQKDQDREDSASSSTNRLMQDERRTGATRQQDREDSASGSTHRLMQDERRTGATRQRSPGASPPSNEQRHSAQPRSCQEEPSHVPAQPHRTPVPQAYKSHQDAQQSRNPDTWEDKWTRRETIDYFYGRSRNR